MTSFLLGVVSSWAASVLVVLTGWLASRRARRWVAALPLRLTGLGVVQVYRTQQEANDGLAADLARARWVKVIAGRGNELTRDAFQQLWQGGARRLDFVRVLLPDPDPEAAPSWLAEREKENMSHDPGYQAGLLAGQVRANIAYLLAAARPYPAAEVRLFNLPNVARVVATDRVAYLTTYQPDAHGRHSPCLVALHPGPLYDFAVRIFDTAWTHATEAGTRHGAAHCGS